MTPLAIDLFCGLGGWTEGLLAEGYDVVGFDIERHEYGEHRYPAQLVLQDVRTLHGSQFRGASVIVASPPCQRYSYMAMPFSRSKAMAAEYRSGVRDINELNELFNACFRIAREADVPLIVENVKGAQPWVGSAKWSYGSFYLWGDLPALMVSAAARKGFGGTWFHNAELGTTNPNRSRTADGVKVGAAAYQPGVVVPEGTGKTSWFFGNTKHQLRGTSSGGTSSGSQARKQASAQIAKIPAPLARHIAKCFKPEVRELCI